MTTDALLGDAVVYYVDSNNNHNNNEAIHNNGLGGQVERTGNLDHDLPAINIIIGVVLCIIIVATIAGNVLVFVAIASKKNLQTVSNMFIVSLSLADLLVGTIVMVPAMLNEVLERWVLAEKFCSIWASFDVMLCSASILNVCLISLDRYLVIMQPLRYNAIMTFKRACVLLLTAWIIAILASIVPIENGWHTPDNLHTLENLTLISEYPQCKFVVSLPFALGASIVTILLPIAIAFMLYYQILKEARRQHCLLKVLIVPSNVVLRRGMEPRNIREPYTRKATVTLGIIVGAYVVTWAPFLISNITEVFCRCISTKLFSGFVWLGYCNSLINPIIYPLFMRDFRQVYLEFLVICCPCIRTLEKHKEYVKEMELSQQQLQGLKMPIGAGL